MKDSQSNPINDYIDSVIEQKLSQKLQLINIPLQQQLINQPPINRIDIHQASAITGYSIKSIYSMVSRNQIPHKKKRGMLFFYRDVLEAWMEEDDSNKH